MASLHYSARTLRSIVLVLTVLAGCKGGDQSIIVDFQLISVTVGGDGAGEGRVVAPDPNVDLDCAFPVVAGTCSVSFSDAGGGGSFALVATPAAGSTFSGWSGDCAHATGPSCALSFDPGPDRTFTVRVRFDLEASVCEALAGDLAPLDDISGTGPPQPGDFEAAFGVNALINEGFEDGPVTIGTLGALLPTSYGYWQGDRASRVASQQGISPRTGDSMLHFIATGLTAGATTAGEMLQLVKVEHLGPHVSAGRVQVTASAWFNRVQGCPDRTNTRFGIWVAAMPGDPSEAGERWRVGGLSGSSGYVEGGWLERFTTPQAFLSDDDPETWEEVSITAQIPVGTTYLVVNLAALENVNSTAVFPEFDGHYADDAAVVLLCQGEGCPE